MLRNAKSTYSAKSARDCVQHEKSNSGWYHVGIVETNLKSLFVYGGIANVRGRCCPSCKMTAPQALISYQVELQNAQAGTEASES